jgi:hypothetical protein
MLFIAGRAGQAGRVGRLRLLKIFLNSPIEILTKAVILPTDNLET